MAKPSEILAGKFPFEPTRGQQEFFQLFDDFLLNNTLQKPVLVLRGYAGTGKTTVVSAIVKMLPFFDYRYVLMAPTGRAAKVMAGYTNRTAFTIHKKIFQQTAQPGGGLVFKRQSNYHKNTLFIVDEASMISNRSEFGKQGLLAELMDFVFSKPHNKLLLIGDGAQLPPVGSEESPALEADFLENNFGNDVKSIELTEVMRQKEESGILFNATKLRMQLPDKEVSIKLVTSRFEDIFKMTSEKLEDGLRYGYEKYGTQNTVIICRSNKSAVQYNRYIRKNIQDRGEEPEAGDILMIVRNNYYFLPDHTPAGFLANGDFVEVLEIIHFEEYYGLRFANMRLRLSDYPEQEPFEAKVILDTLYASETSLNSNQYKRLYEEVIAGYEELSTKTERNKALKNDPYLNALQVKFAYALTCHKSQGGQWDAVFVDQGYLTEEMIDWEYIRWLYTAITRATKELFLVNFHPRFFSS